MFTIKHTDFLVIIRVSTISKLYITVTGIILPNFKSQGQRKDPHGWSDVWTKILNVERLCLCKSYIFASL